jgi:hypothetical protein
MRNKEQKRDLSVQAIAGLPTIGMIPTKLFQGWNARLPAQRGYFTIHGNKNKPLDKLMPDCVRRVEIPAGSHSSRLGFPRSSRRQRLLNLP